MTAAAGFDWVTPEGADWLVNLAWLAVVILVLCWRSEKPQRPQCARCQRSADRWARRMWRPAWLGWPGHDAGLLPIVYGAERLRLHEPVAQLPSRCATPPTGHEVRTWILTERFIEATGWEEPSPEPEVVDTRTWTIRINEHEQKLVDLMAALDQSVNEAKAARDRHRVIPGRVGQVVRDPISGLEVILCCRMSSGDGWWLRDGEGGIYDLQLAEGFELVDEFRDGPPCRCTSCTRAAADHPAAVPAGGEEAGDAG